MARKIIHLLLCAGLIFFPGSYIDAYRGDEPFQNYRQPSFQPDYQRHLNLDRYSNPLSLNIRSWIKPDLDINMWSMKLPAIQVRDIGNSVWTFEKLDNRFNAEFKAYDHYVANIHFNFSGVQAPNQVQMEMGKMKFGEGSLIPQSYRKVYQDKVGNSFMRERTDQKGFINDSYNRFIQFYQRREHGADFGETKASRPPEPSKELVEGFRENWNVSIKVPGGGSDSFTLQIDSIKYESNLKRFITEYKGNVQKADETIFFKVNSPHDMNGNIQKIEVEMWGKGAPTANVTWNPAEGMGGERALSLLRENLPIPLLIGPNSGIRMNGVDLPETPVRVTEEGNLSRTQLASSQDLSNLMGKENLGLRISFQSQSNENQSSGLSFKNAAQNFWYMVTGRWADVKGMRQDVATMRNSNPAKFVLAIGFRDPSFISLKDLKMIQGQNAHEQTTDIKRIDVGKKSSFMQVVTKPIKAVLNAAWEVTKGSLRFAGVVVGAVLELPVVKQVWTGARVLTGVITGIPSGDSFDRSLAIQFDESGPAAIYVNGIWNNKRTVKRDFDNVLEAMGIEKGTIIKNGTHWIFGDWVQIIAHEYLGAIDRPTRDLARAIKIGIEEKGEVFVIAHSQGTGIFKQALSLLSSEEKSKIHYLGLGPQWNIDSAFEGLATARNVRNEGDVVPMLGNHLKLITNLIFPWNWGRTSHRDLVTQNVGARSATEAHSFDNYVGALKEWAQERRGEWMYGALQAAY